MCFKTLSTRAATKLFDTVYQKKKTRKKRTYEKIKDQRR